MRRTRVPGEGILLHLRISIVKVELILEKNSTTNSHLHGAKQCSLEIAVILSLLSYNLPKKRQKSFHSQPFCSHHSGIAECSREGGQSHSFHRLLPPDQVALVIGSINEITLFLIMR